MRHAGTTSLGASRLQRRAGLPILVVLTCCAAASAQSPEAPLQLKHLSAAGAQSQVTETWSSLRFALANPTAQDREARILTFYPGAPGRQYGRDVWVPAKALLWSWSCLGP